MPSPSAAPCMRADLCGRRPRIPTARSDTVFSVLSMQAHCSRCELFSERAIRRRHLHGANPQDSMRPEMGLRLVVGVVAVGRSCCQTEARGMAPYCCRQCYSGPAACREAVRALLWRSSGTARRRLGRQHIGRLVTRWENPVQSTCNAMHADAGQGCKWSAVEPNIHPKVHSHSTTPRCGAAQEVDDWRHSVVMLRFLYSHATVLH